MSRTRRYLQALNEGLRQAMEADERVLVLGEDIRQSLRGDTVGLVDTFGPNRVVDTPISEAAFTGVATGAAMAGLRPVVEFQISSLVYPAFDQLVNQAAKLRHMTGGQFTIPVVYLVMASGPRGNTAGQHSDNPYAFMLQGNIKAVMPASPYDVKGLIISAIEDDDPVALFAPAGCLGLRAPVPEEPYTIPLGSGSMVRDGTDLTIVAVGQFVAVAERAAQQLGEQGISTCVWDPRSLFPFDREGYRRAVSRTGRLLILDDSNPMCSFGAWLVQTALENCFTDLRTAPQVLTRSGIPTPFSPPLESASTVVEDSVIGAAHLLCQQAPRTLRFAHE